MNKQVVINGGETYGGLLTPYWMVEYYKRKGIDIYCYNENLGMDVDDEVEYELINPIELNDNTKIYRVYFLRENKGNLLTEVEMNNILDNLSEEDLKIFYYNNGNINRQDKDLIDIAKEINDESLIKVVEIPSDVSYYIEGDECGFGETIVEKSRRWY